MEWFFFGLIPPLLYAVTNVIDKNLLEKYFPEENGATTLLMFSALMSIVIVPIAFVADTSVLDVSPQNAAWLIIVAVLDITLIWAYLKALQQDDTTTVIVFYQSMPVMALVFGFIILGETITGREGLAMAIIIVGTALVSFERKTDGGTGFNLKRKTILYMGIACIAWSLETVLFKAVALEENVWRSLFWEHVILAVIAMVIALLLPKQRRAFVDRFKRHSRGIITLNVVNEAIYMTGNVVVAFVAMLAPVALILLMQTYQAIFVFVIGICLAIFLPKRSADKLPSATEFVQRIGAIAITGVGSYILLT